MSNIEFDSPAARVIEQFSGIDKEQFRIPTNLPDLAFLRALSIQGRLRTFSGVETDAAAVDLITITPAVGETFFIYNLILNTNSVATTNFRVLFGNDIRLSVRLLTANSTFNTKYFDSFVGNGTSSIIVQYTNSIAGIKTANLLGWVENTSRIRDVSI